MTYRGVRCTIPNERDHYLYKLLNGVGIVKYHWLIEDSEIYVSLEDLFPRAQYAGDEFQRAISGDVYYIIHARIQGSISGGFSEAIESYGDFCESDCQIYVVIIDCIFVDIYVKCQTVADIIRQNAIKYDFGDVISITEQNDRNLR